MSRYWYSLVVGSGDPRLSSNYQLITNNNGKPGCIFGSQICAIYAPAGGPFPFSPLSPNMMGYIATALSTLTPQPPGEVGRYVYLKS